MVTKRRHARGPACAEDELACTRPTVHCHARDRLACRPLWSPSRGSGLKLLSRTAYMPPPGLLGEHLVFLGRKVDCPRVMPPTAPLHKAWKKRKSLIWRKGARSRFLDVARAHNVPSKLAASLLGLRRVAHSQRPDSFRTGATMVIMVDHVVVLVGWPF